jgi:hypothetical protein
MCNRVKRGLGCLLVALGGLASWAGLAARDAEPAKTPDKAAAAPSEPIKPKPLSDNVKKGLAYLISQQRDNGGWGQGGGWRIKQGGGRVEGGQVQDPSDVANTCIATLALLRAGHTPKEGEYARNVARAIDFICSHIEESDQDSLYVTKIRGTQIQSKIGPYADTFLATLVLAELKGKCADDKSEKRLVAALNKTIAKIEKNQQKDGSFAGNQGWASVLSQGLASKGINRAYQAGAAVRAETLERDQKQSVAGLDKKDGTFKPAPAGRIGEAGSAPSDAGVAIYSTSGKTAGITETYNSLKAEEKKNREIAESKTATKEEKAQAERKLMLLRDAEEAQDAAVRGLTARVKDQRFVAGFGSNGGEEFLSFLNISETLLAKGGKEWQEWDKAITDNLNRIQDKDGGWSGHHCITGRTFCTAGALLVLMADRAPIPQIAKGDKK